MDSETIAKAIRSAKLDAEVEVVAHEIRSISIAIERGEFSDAVSSGETRAIVRCIRKGQLSSVVANLNSVDALNEAIRSAYNLAKKAGSEDCQTFFSDKAAAKIAYPISKKAGLVKIDSIISKMLAAKRAVSSLPHIYSVNLSISSNRSTIFGANSCGIANDWKGSRTVVSADIIAKNGADQAIGDKYAEALDPYELDFEKVATEASVLANNMLGAKQAPTFRGELLIARGASNAIIDSFVSGINGEEVLKGRSFMSGKKGAVIAAPIIRLREERVIKGSPHNRNFDDELVPTLSKNIISGGRLETYLHNIYSAEKMGEKPTGNGFFGEGGNIGATNVVLSPGKESEEDMISKIKKGIFLIETGDSPNMATGDLSAMVMNGYYVENGKKMYPVKETMIGINMIDLMKNVGALSSETFSFDGTSAPAMLVKNVQVSCK